MAVQWERKEQTYLVKWFHLKYRNILLDASPNPGKMDKKKAAMMSAEGLLAGSPDIRVYKACRGYHGLFVELKVDKTERHARGRVSEIQQECIDKLNAAGYHAVVCFGWISAKEIIDWYLNEI